jgi:hypothetical protein
MRRSLVITDEKSRHPFLATLPPHVRGGGKAFAPKRGRGFSMTDWRDFLLAYCACFVAASAFIA